MRIRSRKHIAFVVTRAGLLVLLAVVLQRAGYLVPLESLLYDERVRLCQADRPAPAASLVHLDVDDNALNYVGRWPWPRTTLARMIDEIALSRPKVLAIDVLLAEPTQVVYGKGDAVGVDEDQRLADAIRRLGCAIVPVSLNFVAPATSSIFHQRMLALLVEDPERTEAQCIALLRTAHMDRAYIERDPGDSFLQIRETAFHERIERELSKQDDGPGHAPGHAVDRAAVRQAVLPHTDRRFTGTPLGRLFDQQFDIVQREQAVRRFMLPMPADAPPLLVADEGAITPILPIARATAHCAFINYLPESVEGTVRSVPLLAEYQGRMIAQMGLVAACVATGADLSGAQLKAGTLTIPRHGEGGGTPPPPVVIPVSERDLTVGRVGLLMDVPLFGRARDWLTMYDAPLYTRPVAHVSAYRVYQACDTHDRLQHNLASATQLLAMAAGVTGDAPLAAGTLADRPAIAAALRDLSDYVHAVGAESNLDAATQQLLTNARRIETTLGLVSEQVDQLQEQLDQQRAALRADLGDKAIFFGGTATSLTDQHPTAMFGQCPGIVVHGAIYNAILTGKMWRRTPPAVGTAVTTAAGLITLLLVTGLSPGKAFVAAASLAVGYLGFNGFYLFARHDLIVEAAGPIFAVGLVWSVTTLTSFLAEIGERTRITRRFRSYQDPALVDYVIDHPEHVKFDGEQRELTVGFSDIQGFTTLTDELGAKVVPLLAEYMGHMVPIARGKGTVLQQMGDGLLFVFGAPRPDADHAGCGVAAALEMHAALAGFNRTLVARGDRPLAIRVGLATGEVVVGDAGPPDAYTYLALGATTNLAARLESANKFFGTRILINARTAELLGEQFLLRPIAYLRVAGKLSCTMVYEPLCRTEDATDADRRLARCTTEMVDAYRAGDFAACRRVATAMAAESGPGKLTDLYLARSAGADPNREEHCDGQIVMNEK